MIKNEDSNIEQMEQEGNQELIEGYGRKKIKKEIKFLLYLGIIFSFAILVLILYFLKDSIFALKHPKIDSPGYYPVDRTRTKSYRYAEEKDIPLILFFIKELANYEKMLDQVVATEELLKEWIFEKKKAEVIFALENDYEVGFALFYYNFYPFLGKPGMYLSNLYVRPENRKGKYGKMLLSTLAEIAIEKGCERLEWWCLDWNQPSINFYLGMGAEPMKDWTVYRVTGENLTKLVNKNYINSTYLYYYYIFISAKYVKKNCLTI